MKTIIKTVRNNSDIKIILISALCLVFFRTARGITLAMTDNRGFSFARGYVWPFLAAAVYCGIICLMNTRRKLIGSWIVYALVLVILITALFSSGSRYGHWLMLHYSRYPICLPALLPLVLFALAGALSGPEKSSFHNMLFKYFICCFIPIFLAFQNRLGMDTIFAMIISTALLFFKVDPSKSKIFRLLVIILFMVSSLVIALNTEASDRFRVILSRGASDPEGEGYYLSKLSSCLSGVKIFGASGTGNVQDTTAFSFTYSQGANLSFTAVNFGWISVGLILIGAAFIVFALYRMSGMVSNRYARNYIFGCACFFTIRSLLSFICEFFVEPPSSSVILTGNRTEFIVDAVLLFSAVSLFAGNISESEMEDVYSSFPKFMKARNKIFSRKDKIRGDLKREVSL